MNLTLLTDLYQLTMMQGYFKNNNNDTVVFDAFYRTNPSGNGFAIAAGLEQVIDYLKNLRFSSEDIEYLRGRNCCVPKRTFDQGNCTNYAGTVN